MPSGSDLIRHSGMRKAPPGIPRGVPGATVPTAPGRRPRNFTVSATTLPLSSYGTGNAALRWSPPSREGSISPVPPEVVGCLGVVAVALQGPSHVVRASLRAFRLWHPAVSHDPRLAGERPAT